MKLVIVFGPPAVGKMAVGMELERLTGMKLLHNHMTIDLVLRFFPWGHPSFQRLTSEFRRRICEEVAASELPGMIFTYVWALDQPSDRAFVDSIAAIFTARGAEVCYAELFATQEERLRRNETPLRLAEKRPKRDLEHSRRILREADAAYRLNSDGDFFYPDRHVRIDTTDLAPDETARRIAAAFGLPLAAT